MHRNKSVRAHDFAMIPDSRIPRSQFKTNPRHLTTFDSGYLVPHFVQEVLPGDTWNLRHTIFARLATPLYPVMDNLYLDTFYYFVPLRLLWTNFKRMMGEQDNPADSISFIIPQQVSPVGGYAVGSLQDYMGLPTTGMLGANTKSHSAMWTRAYNFIYNTCFRDENLQNSITFDTGDGPDATPSANYILRRRGKRFDYFTGALPWPQKGATGVTIPIAGTAPVLGIGKDSGNRNYPGSHTVWETGASATTTYPFDANSDGSEGTFRIRGDAATAGKPNIYANLAAATGVLINQLRLSIQIQEYLELDARGGTRYVEFLRSHFGVVSPDFRQQRPEYLGGGSKRINFSPVAQTSGTAASGTTTPMGTLAAMATVADHGNGFVYSSTEHGVIIGMMAVRADLSYQQGLHRMWTRSTRYDFYDPMFAHLGEQAVRNDEIYCDGSANDILTFGYQERWAEYRYMPSRVSGLFKSTSAGTIDAWHMAQKFASLPTLNSTFIQDTPPLDRVIAVGASANGQQLIADCDFDITLARPMPMYSVPGISARL